MRSACVAVERTALRQRSHVVNFVPDLVQAGPASVHDRIFNGDAHGNVSVIKTVDRLGGADGNSGRRVYDRRRRVVDDNAVGADVEHVAGIVHHPEIEGHAGVGRHGKPVEGLPGRHGVKLGYRHGAVCGASVPTDGFNGAGRVIPGAGVGYGMRAEQLEGQIDDQVAPIPDADGLHGGRGLGLVDREGQRRNGGDGLQHGGVSGLVGVGDGEGVVRVGRIVDLRNVAISIRRLAGIIGPASDHRLDLGVRQDGFSGGVHRGDDDAVLQILGGEVVVPLHDDQGRGPFGRIIAAVGDDLVGTVVVVIQVNLGL